MLVVSPEEWVAEANHRRPTPSVLWSVNSYLCCLLQQRFPAPCSKELPPRRRDSAKHRNILPATAQHRGLFGSFLAGD